MSNYLVKESADYADEFNCEGFKVMQGESKKEIVQSLIDCRDGDFPMSCSFGTNEELHFENREEFEEALDIQKITDEDLKTLKKLFPDCDKFAFGTTGIL